MMTKVKNNWTDWTQIQDKWMTKTSIEISTLLIDMGVTVFPKIGVRYPKMDGLSMKILLKWMIWGETHYFRKQPYWDHRFSTKSSGFFHRFNFNTLLASLATVSCQQQIRTNRFSVAKLEKTTDWAREMFNLQKTQKKSTPFISTSKFILPKNEKTTPYISKQPSFLIWLALSWLADRTGNV